MRVVAIIPSLGERPELQPLLKQLVEEKIEVIILSRPEEQNIHTIWNQGVKWAKEWNCDAVAILNDDIQLPINTITTMYKAMDKGGFSCVGVDPDPKTPFGIPGTIKTKEIKGEAGTLMSGITTWCYLVRIDAWSNIDEQYQWWWGAGDLFTKIFKHGGKLGQISGLGIKHFGSGTAKNHKWTNEAINQDRKKWGEANK